METLVKEAIEQKCITISMWIRKREDFRRHGERRLTRAADIFVDKWIKELRELIKDESY